MRPVVIVKVLPPRSTDTDCSIRFLALSPVRPALAGRQMSAPPGTRSPRAGRGLSADSKAPRAGRRGWCVLLAAETEGFDHLAIAVDPRRSEIVQESAPL